MNRDDPEQKNIEEWEIVEDNETAGEKIKKFREKLKSCEVERKEYLDGWQRARAELINYKKDESKRWGEMASFAAENMAADLLSILDSFDLALAGLALDAETKKGIILIRWQLEEALRRHGLAKIALEPGEQFDPAKHEGVGEIESSYPEGRVAEIIQNGYWWRGKVLRPARVKISKITNL